MALEHTAAFRWLQQNNIEYAGKILASISLAPVV